MSTDVELPDGSVLSVETDDPTQAAAAAKAYLSKQALTPAATAQPPAPMSGFQRFLSSAKTAGIDAPAQLLTHALPGNIIGAVNRGAAALNAAPVIGPITKALGMTPAEPGQIDQAIAADEARRRASAGEGIDWPSIAGSIAGSVPMAAALPGIGAGPGVMRGLASGAMQGGVAGALSSPVTENADQNFGEQKTLQSVLGGITGGATGALGGALGAAISPKVDPNAMELLNRGILPTPGQILGGAAKTIEGKAESFPGFGDMIRRAKGQTVEDLNKEIYNSALEPIGARSTQPVGQLGMQEVQKKLSDEFNGLIPKLTFQADNQFANDLRSTIDDARLVLSGRESTTFDNILREKVFPAFSEGGGMTGESMQKVMSELEKQAGKYGSDPSAYVQDLGNAFDEVRSLMMANLVRQNPAAGGHLARINEGWAKFSVLRNAASRTGQDEASKQGVVSPGNYFAAVKHADETPFKSRFAVDRGALMQDLAQPAVSVLGSAYPNSGSPGRIFLGALASGGLGAIHPALAATALAGMGAYTRPGQRMLAAGLTRRPWWAPTARRAVESSNPYLALSAEKLRQDQMR